MLPLRRGAIVLSLSPQLIHEPIRPEDIHPPPLHFFLSSVRSQGADRKLGNTFRERERRPPSILLNSPADGRLA